MRVLEPTKATITGDGDNTVNSAPWDFRHLSIGAFQLKYTNALTGSAKIQRSCDLENWVDVTTASKALANASGDDFIDYPGDVKANWLRIQYAPTTGQTNTGTITITPCGKGV